MAKFEFKTHASGDHINPQTIEADDYQMDTVGGKLTFTDDNNEQIASYAISAGAFVRRVGK